MNPSPYGQQLPPQGWPQPPQQQQQQQQQQQPPPPMGGPQLMPPQSQGMLNGNYQQQLVNTMSGMSVNPMKAYPSGGGNAPPPLMGNGPNVDQSVGPNNNIMPSNSPGGIMGYPNGPLPPTSIAQNAGPPMPPMQQANQPPTSMLPPSMGRPQQFRPPQQPQQIEQSKKPDNPFPPSMNSSLGGPSQMTVNSANMPGMPHMPPPKTSSPFMPPQSAEPAKPQDVQQQKPPLASPFPPQAQMQQKYPPQQMPPTSQPGLMYPPQQNQMQQPPAPQQPPPPQQQQQQQQQQMQQQPPQQQQQQMQYGQMPPRPGQQMPPPSQMHMQMPPQPGSLPPQPGQMQMPPQPGSRQMPPFAGQLPPQPGQMPPQPGQMPPQPGQMPPQPGQMPPQPGQMPPQPGQMPPQPGQMPPHPGQMPPHPGQMPFQQGGPMQYQPGPMPPQPGVMPSYPSQPGQMPMQPGQQMPGQPGRGYNQPPGGYNQQYQQQPAAAQRRLDPDQMPNPIQVMIENQRNAGGAFVTNQPGLLPPLATTKYVVQDQGNSSPRLVRSSLYCVPSTADLLKTTALPFCLIVSPYAKAVEGEYDAPIVDFGELGPIRCNRCKAYMSPNMQFIDAGRRFHCLMCKVSTEVPTEYFQHLDHTGQRVDKYERPELVLGTYEFVATKDYCRNNTPPEIPAFVFIIDVSYNNIKSGLVHLLCQEIKRILKHFPVDQGQEKSKMRVGFITYNSSVHFYNIKSNLAQPQMMVVGDVNDMFMPLLDGFLVDPEESEAVIDALMEQIPKMFVDTKETETILLPAIQAGLEALKASNCTGKLLVFNSSLPISEAPGKLRNRDDRKLLGTEKEKTILTPQTTAYNTLGQECVAVGCSVDLFVFNNSYIDLATIGQVSRLTGGEVYKYTYFQADLDGKRLIEDIIKNVSRPIAFDSVMRVRTSAGIRATDFYGHFFMSNTTDVELASIDSNKAIAIEIKHDDKLPPEENIYLQIALLYTSCSGQRRLRILNLALKVTTIIADVFKSCDLDAIMLFFAKQSMFKLMELSPKVVKDTLLHRSAQILACYRKHCTSPTSAGQLILPECLKLLPMYVSCLIKNDAISGGSDMTTDDRSYIIQFVLSMDLQMSVTFFYPRFIPIHNVDPDDTDLPLPMRVTHEKMAEDGAYILENGIYLFLWLGQSLPQSFIQPLFNVQCTQQVNAERFAIVGDTPLAKRVQQIIDIIMEERTRYMRVTCVRQNDKLESVFRHFLIEDRGTDGSASYVDFLCHMHKEIKDLLS